MQTGFGPFIAVYLSADAWTQGEIGAALSVGTVAGMVSQLPGGALVDWLRNKRSSAQDNKLEQLVNLLNEIVAEGVLPAL